MGRFTISATCIFPLLSDCLHQNIPQLATMASTQPQQGSAPAQTYERLRLPFNSGDAYELGRPNDGADYYLVISGKSAEAGPTQDIDVQVTMAWIKGKTNVYDTSDRGVIVSCEDNDGLKVPGAVEVTAALLKSIVHGSVLVQVLSDRATGEVAADMIILADDVDSSQLTGASSSETKDDTLESSIGSA